MIEHGSECTNKYRVLIVDDSKSMKSMLTALLSSEGYECIAVDNGRDAIRAVKENHFDAVLTDIVMPEIDGITLTRYLSGMFPDLPVMIITGFVSDYTWSLAIDAGAKEYIGKPFSSGGFLARFNSMMINSEDAKKLNPARSC
jgi:two-component system response regulator ResD